MPSRSEEKDRPSKRSILEKQRTTAGKCEHRFKNETSQVFSVVTCAAETWMYSVEVKRRNREFEMWTYRRILKISWTERVTNEVVKQRMNAKEDLVMMMARRKMKYAGHIFRGLAGVLLSLATEGIVEGKFRRRKEEEYGVMT